jgi:hypothetical protein
MVSRVGAWAPARNAKPVIIKAMTRDLVASVIDPVA